MKPKPVFVPLTDKQKQRMEAFREYCEARAASVESKYSRWLEDQNGEDSYEDYCVDCVELQRWRNRHGKNGFTRISGWDDSFESDGQLYCERCGILLDCSLTEYGIEQEIEYLSQATSLTDSDCWLIARFIGGFGCFGAAKHWPQIEPHIERLTQ